MLAELKILATKNDVPYQSLAKIYLARQTALERGRLNGGVDCHAAEPICVKVVHQIPASLQAAPRDSGN